MYQFDMLTDGLSLELCLIDFRGNVALKCTSFVQFIHQSYC